MANRSARSLSAAVGVVFAVLVATTWAATASSAQESSADHMDVPYATSDPDQKLDVYLPEDPGVDRPAIVFIHGGGFRRGTKAMFATEADIARQRGWVGFAIDYRLDAEPGHPAELDDVLTAIDWVRDHADEYGVDPNRIALYGTSAGGNLAALAATSPQGADRAIAAVVSFSGPMNLEAVHGANPGNARTVEAYLGCSPVDCPLLYSDASPTSHVTEDDAPMFLANSADEGIPESVARDLAERLEAVGVPVELEIVPGSLHARGLSRETPGLLERAMDFLSVQFGRETSHELVEQFDEESDAEVTEEPDAEVTEEFDREPGYERGLCISETPTSAVPFSDVPGGAYYSASVAWMYGNEISEGIALDLFGPQSAVTRGQFAAILHRMACMPTAPAAHPFTDVPAGAFYEDAVGWLIAEEIAEGRTPTTFAPEGDMTRGELAAFLYRFVGSPAPMPVAHAFDDVDRGRFYTAPVDWLVDRGLTTGTEPNMFSPERTITRAEVATFLYRLDGLAD